MHLHTQPLLFGNVVAATLLTLAASLPASAAVTVIDFESLSDLEPVTSQFAGLTFSNATAQAAGASLNEFEFPPRSGSRSVIDSGGPLTIEFASPMVEVGAFFTYATSLHIDFYGAGNLLLGSAASAFGNNMASSGAVGSSPNEFIGFSGADIRRIVVTGDPRGLSFTMDDLTFDNGGPTVAEPATAVLVLAALGLGAWRRRRPSAGDD